MVHILLLQVKTRSVKANGTSIHISINLYEIQSVIKEQGAQETKRFTLHEHRRHITFCARTQR